MRLKSCHRTFYRYPAPAKDSHNELRLMPLTDEFQTCESFEVRLNLDSLVHSYEEPGGMVHFFDHRSPHSALEILTHSVVETNLTNPFEGLNLTENDLGFYDSDEARLRYAEYLTSSPFVRLDAKVYAFAQVVADAVRLELSNSAGSAANFLLGVCHWIHDHFEYQAGLTTIHTTVDEVIDLRAGVCQDFAHLMIACCRALGIPARYVSGYLMAEFGDGLRGEHATHAWLECPMPDGRWLALDPTNRLLANDRYERIHTGRDYADVPPTRGVYVGAPAEALEVSVWVERT